MCTYKLYHNNRISRRRRKWLAVLFFTSGLTMFILLHHGTVISPMDMETIEENFLPTNDTPTDMFLGDAAEKSANLHSDLDQIDSSYLGIHNNKKFNFLFNNEQDQMEKDITIPPTCCTDDFHQSPYLSDEEVLLLNERPSKKNTKKRPIHRQHSSHSSPLNEDLKKQNTDRVFFNKDRSQTELHQSYKNNTNGHTNISSYSSSSLSFLNKKKSISTFVKSSEVTTSVLNKTINNFIRGVEQNGSIPIKTISNIYSVEQKNYMVNDKLRRNGSVSNLKPDRSIENDASTTNTSISPKKRQFLTQALTHTNTLTSAELGDDIIDDQDKPHPKTRKSFNKSKTNKEHRMRSDEVAALKVSLLNSNLAATKYTYSINNFNNTNTNSNTNTDNNKNINNNNRILINEQNASIIIPEASIPFNISFVTQKNRALDHLLTRIDLAQMFSNSSYRNIILSRDLSQWDELLRAPEDSPQHTFEPSFLESYDWKRTSKPVIEDKNYNSSHINHNGQKPSNPITNYNPLKNLRPWNNKVFPFSVRDIPRHKIRSSIHVATELPEAQPSTHQSPKRLDVRAKLGGGEPGVEPGPAPEGEAAPSPPPLSPDRVFPFRLDYTRPAHFPWQSTTDECHNFATRFLAVGTGQVVPLASFPGSGNTWLRYISEATIGVFTGSMYEDEVLAVKGFWGERDSYLEGTTLLQKAHSFPVVPKDVTKWDGRMILGPSPRKVVLMIRSPYEALVSLRHFHVAGHTGFGHHGAFAGQGWNNFTEERARLWLRLNQAWLLLPDTKILVIHYEMLMQSLDNEVKRLLKFLGVPIDYGRLACLSRYPEGKFRRPRYPKHLQGYQISHKAAITLSSAITSLNTLLTEKGHPTLPTHLYSFHPSTYQAKKDTYWLLRTNS